MQFPTVFDSSILASLKACPTLFRLTYCEDWKPKEASVHLHAGAAFAKGIEVARTEYYVNGASPDLAVAAGLTALLKHYGAFECPADSAKSAERMAGAFEFYFDNYPLNQVDDRGIACDPILLPSGRRGIEFSFAHPLPINHPESGDPILYCGRMDALLNFAGGVFICDEKTTTQLGASWSRQWDLRAQFTGYAWGCEQAGIHVDGAIVRGVSILKTKYDTQQAVTYRPEWQIDRWYAELLEWITDAIGWYKRGIKGFKHNLDHSCAEYGGCTFRQVCSSQEEANWLDTYFERRHWNPITREETKT